tara:strand:+ start:873 stop:2669 length:1797 start_codon:yes stop_codon:yes gene_type:complete
MIEPSKVWHDVWEPPDTRELWEWAEDNISLPSGAYAVPGRFDVSSVPFLKEPMRALLDPGVRCVSAMAAVQGLKTLLGEIWQCHCIAENPGPMQWLQPSDEDAKEHAKERTLALIESCDAINKFYTDSRHDKSTSFFRFKHMWFRMEGGGTKQNLPNVQRKSVKNQMCSEIWLWDSGMLAEAESRLTQFAHNSKRYCEGQGGVAGDDWTVHWEQGTQEILNTRCQSCRAVMPLKFSTKREDGSRACMRWDDNETTRRKDGLWNFEEVFKTIRFECPRCGHDHFDNPSTRSKLLDDCHYIQTNDGASTTHRSFRWNQIIIKTIPWSKLVERWLMAVEQRKTGDETKQTQFIQKALAEPDDPMNRFEAVTPTPYQAKGRWKKLAFTFMTVDVQSEGYWVVVRGWARDGSSRLFYAGYVLQDNEVSGKQAEFPEVGNSNVGIDAGNDAARVYRLCASQDGPGHWQPLKGSGEESFRVRYQSKGKEIKRQQFFTWPPTAVNAFRGTGQGSVTLGLVTWSNPAVKDILFNLRDGRGAKWEVYPEVCEDWKKHLFSEKAVINPKSRKRIYVPVGRGVNHLLDCEAMQVVMALRAGILEAGGARR